MNLDNLSEFQIDALRETGSIGAGHAATALSQLIGHPISIDIPRLDIVPMGDVPLVFGGAETLVGACHMALLGDLPGNMLFMASRNSSLALVDLLRSRPPGTAKSFGGDEEALVTNVAQILASAYLAAVARLSDLSILPSRPSFSFDMAGAILQAVSAETGMKAESAVLQRTRFMDEEVAVEAYLFFLPDPEGLEVLLARLGVA